MRLWHLDVRGDAWPGGVHVFAPDAAAAREAFVSYVFWAINDLPDLPPLEVQAVVEVSPSPARILDLHMRDPAVSGPRTGGDGPTIWKVTYRDGLHHRPVGATLVAATTAVEARALVEAADPFEGRPFNGVPAVYDPAEPFLPERP